MTNWLEIVLGAREAEGIDFWWLDWQQGESWISIPLINPTIWLNYIFFTNPYHWKNNTVRIIRSFIVSYVSFTLFTYRFVLFFCIAGEVWVTTATRSDSLEMFFQ